LIDISQQVITEQGPISIFEWLSSCTYGRDVLYVGSESKSLRVSENKILFLQTLDWLKLFAHSSGAELLVQLAREGQLSFDVSQPVILDRNSKTIFEWLHSFEMGRFFLNALVIPHKPKNELMPLQWMSSHKRSLCPHQEDSPNKKTDPTFKNWPFQQRSATLGCECTLNGCRRRIFLCLGCYDEMNCLVKAN
jgi:hypothetical protein